MKESLSEIFNLVAQITLVIFGISLFWIIRTVRKQNRDYVAAQAEWWIFPMVDFKASLSFFIWAYKEYAKIKGSRFLVSVNLISFFLTILIIIGFLASIVAEGLS